LTSIIFFFKNKRSIKKAQLTAVIVIVLLVAAVGGFIIFSEKRSGEATRALKTAYQQPPVQAPQAYIPPGGVQPNLAKDGIVASRPSELSNLFNLRSDCPPKPTCVVNGAASTKKLTLEISVDWFKSADFSKDVEGELLEFEREFKSVDCAASKASTESNAMKCLAELMPDECMYGNIVCTDKTSKYSKSCSYTKEYYPDKSPPEAYVTVICTCQLYGFVCDP